VQLRPFNSTPNAATLPDEYNIGVSSRPSRLFEGPEMRVLEAAGVAFTNCDAPGVRLRKKKR
jgi:hypothetical protein